MTIHWWKTEKLVVDLAKGNVSEKESVIYAMIGAVLFYQASYTATWFGGYRSWLLLYEFVVVTAVALFGINECFKANGGEEGVEFLRRYLIISVPVGIKLALAGLLVGRVVYYSFPYLITPTSFRNPIIVFQLMSFSLSVAFVFVYFWRIKTHLARVVRATIESQSKQ